MPKKRPLSRKEIENITLETVVDALDRKILFEHEFGKLDRETGEYDGITRRKNRDVVVGSYRDTVDLGGLKDEANIDVDVKRTGISIKFNVDYASYVFDDRPELEEEILDELPIGDIASALIKSFLAGQNL